HDANRPPDARLEWSGRAAIRRADLHGRLRDAGGGVMARIVVCRIGAGDDFTTEVSQDDTLLPISIEQAGSLSSAGTPGGRALERVGVPPLPSAIDLLTLATVIYSADVCPPRATAYDRWTRDYRLYLPVSDLVRWAAASNHLSQMLGFLTGDRWMV